MDHVIVGSPQQDGYVLRQVRGLSEVFAYSEPQLKLQGSFFAEI
jgi:hypothetical protein